MVGWMTSLTPLMMSSRGPPVIGCTFFFLTGTSWRRRSPRPPPSTPPLHGRPAGRTSGRRGRGAAWLGRPRLRPPSVPPLPWPADRPRFGPPRLRRFSARPVAPQAAVRAFNPLGSSLCIHLPRPDMKDGILNGSEPQRIVLHLHEGY